MPKKAVSEILPYIDPKDGVPPVLDYAGMVRILGGIYTPAVLAGVFT